MALFRKSEQAPRPPEETTPRLPPIEGTSVDFQAVYLFGQVSAEECERVRRAYELVSSLPSSSIEPEARKQIVETTLRVFDLPADRLVEAATRQITALETFLRAAREHTNRLFEEEAREITELEAEIARRRSVQDTLTSEQGARVCAADVELAKLQHVVAFFAQPGVAPASSGSEDQAAPAQGQDTSVPAEPKRANG